MLWAIFRIPSNSTGNVVASYFNTYKYNIRVDILNSLLHINITLVIMKKEIVKFIYENDNI